MPYIQITLEASELHLTLCEDTLNELGALSLSLEDAKDQPLFEPNPNEVPMWNETKIIALFAPDTDQKWLAAQLKEQLPPIIFQTLHIETVQDQDWVRASLDQFQPQYFGNKLWITPTWIDIGEQKKDGDVVVTLDPGLAFGTGTHPTTQLCLEWLAQHPPINKITLDFGCGSGILGIAALKLGAKRVIAVDHDAQALTSTRANAKVNGLIDEQMILCTPEALDPHLQVDLILANILANPIIELSALFKQLLNPHGLLVLSGILNEQCADVVKNYQGWLKDIQIYKRDDWVCIAGGTENEYTPIF